MVLTSIGGLIGWSVVGNRWSVWSVIGNRWSVWSVVGNQRSVIGRYLLALNLILEKKLKEMKAIFIILILSILILTDVNSQPDDALVLSWNIKHSEINNIEEKLADALKIEAQLAFIIPTGKRRLSYILKFDINDNEYDKIGSHFLEIELWADTDGDRLLDFLSCNRELPCMFIREETKLEYNHPDKQPCLGSNLTLYLSAFENNNKKYNHLLKLEKK